MRLPKLGETFEGKYELLQILGKGGFAAVYHARDLEIGREVAIKVLTPDTDRAYSERVAGRFMSEARIIASLQDQHTIRLFEFGQADNGNLYMVFQYVAGEDLAHVLARRGALEPLVAMHVLKQVLSALAEAHEHQILHRDLKPANVLVHEYMGDPFAVKLLDFGIAKTTRSDAPALTATGMMVGTPRYMAPEQLFGEELTTASDVYAIGLVALEMLTGSPAAGGTPEEAMKVQIDTTPFPIPEVVRGTAIAPVLQKMVAREPAARYPHAGDALVALQRALASMDDQEAVTAPVAAEARVRGPSRVPVAPPQKLPVVPVAVAAMFLGLLLAWFVKSVTQPVPGRTQRPAAKRAPSNMVKSTKQATPKKSADVGRPQESPTEQRRTVRPPADGCGRPAPEHRRLEMQTSTGWEISVAVPIDYDPSHRYPLLVGFTSQMRSAHQYRTHSGLEGMPDAAKGPVYVGLQPRDRTAPWIDGVPVEFVNEAISLTRERFCIDPERTYAAGHGSGARAAFELSCQRRLSGLILSGWLEPDRPVCNQVAPVPTITVHAKRDRRFPAPGGLGCAGEGVVSVTENQKRWRRRNGCKPSGNARSSPDQVACTTWQCDVPYTHCDVDGGHHMKAPDIWWMSMTCDNASMSVRVMDYAWSFALQDGVAHTDVSSDSQ